MKINNTQSGPNKQQRMQKKLFKEKDSRSLV